MKQIFSFLIIIAMILLLPNFITAVCCSNGCFLDKNICCADGLGYIGCQDGNGQYYCYGDSVFSPDACLTCRCINQDNCYWEKNNFCQIKYGSNYNCNLDNPTLPTATECALPPLCPEGTTLCADGYCRDDCDSFHYCDDGTCNVDEDCSSCPADCGTCPLDTCPNGYCGPTEDCSRCPQDCGFCIDCTSICGDDCCDSNEDCASCQADCGTCPADICGNGYCAPNENCVSCQQDCGACICSNQADNCCNAEDDGRCDSDCITGVDPDCPTPCPNTPNNCCNPNKDSVCDTDCIPGVDPDCSPICQNIADFCCNGENDGACDPDCVVNVDPNCPVPCDNTQNNCCNPSADGVCDPDCIAGVDYDCSMNCDYDNNCEAGEGCLCPDCDLKQDSCEAGLLCINGLCRTPTISCSSCKDCDGLFGTCNYNECMLCGANCYYAGPYFLLEDCKTCSSSTTCEDYEQTETTCNADDCTLNNCVWTGAKCITVDYIQINPSYINLLPGVSFPFTVTRYIKDQSYDVTPLTTFSSSNPDTTITSNIISTLSDTDVTARYNTKTATAHINVVGEHVLSHIIIRPPDAILNKGLKLSYTVIAYYSDGGYSDVSIDQHTWYESSNLSVASIDFNSNMVTANSEGIAAITAHYQEGGIVKEATARLKVIAAGKELSHIKLEPQYALIKPGTTKQYTTTAYYSDNTEEDITSSGFITYTPTNIAVASMTGNIATGVTIGLTTIIAKYEKAGITKTDTAMLRVTNDNVISDIYVNPEKVYLIINSRKSLTITADYSDGSSKSCPNACEELKQDIILNIADKSIADIVYNDVSSKYEAIGKKIGTTEAIISYTKDDITVEYKITLAVGDPNSNQEFCELVIDGAQALCDDLETVCWAEAVNEDAEYTDKTKCCGNDGNEIWRYLTATSTGIFSNQDTCYNEVWYTAARSPITYYNLYTKK